MTCTHLYVQSVGDTDMTNLDNLPAYINAQSTSLRSLVAAEITLLAQQYCVSWEVFETLVQRCCVIWEKCSTTIFFAPPPSPLPFK